MSVADVCVVACAEAWRGDGEVLASPIGIIPSLGARLAIRTFEPDLLITDGDACLLAGALPLTAGPEDRVIEGWMPFRNVFAVVWSGRRHVIMGATQIDRHGNQNIANIGPWSKPKTQLLGMRGAPGNTVNHPTSYWVPVHSTRAFVPTVDVASGVGYDRAAAAGPAATRHHEIRFVITNKAVLDFDTPDKNMRLRSVHPGVTVDDVVASTGFELVIPSHVPTTREPTAEEQAIIAELDPAGARDREVRA